MGKKMRAHKKKNQNTTKHPGGMPGLNEPRTRVQMDGLLQKISRPVRIFAVSIGLVFLLFIALWGFVNVKYLSPVNDKNTAKIMVDIPRGSGINTIGKILEESGVIRSRTIFKIYVDLYDRGSKLRAGTYELSPSMTVMEVINTVCSGDMGSNVAKILIKEGYTLKDIANVLQAQGVITDMQAFIKAVSDIDAYTEKYGFLKPVAEDKENRINPLEGYLFPDTYQVYRDATAQEIASKMVAQFADVYTATYEERAQQLGLTMDQVVTLASLIQTEAKAPDFKKVSAVFHNRLKVGMKLQSNATVQYVIDKKRLNLTNADIAIQSPYNTYQVKGLPEGPICNPGKDAIEAALYPDETYVKDKYLYFCLADPKTGQTVFSKTLDEHNANVAKYRPLWIEADKQNQTN